MRKAFCNYYHFTTVALARIVALLPQLRADKSITVLIPHPNKKGQRSPYMRESLRLLGLEDQVMDFPPCRLVFAEELLVAGLGPRTAFGRDRLGRARAIMADVADEGPTRAVRHAVLAALRPPPARESVLLIDRHERRRMANLAEVLDALGKLPSGHTARLIYCEDLSFVEQVSAFQGAQGAVAVSGACLANSLYMPQESLVLDLVTEKNYMGADVVMPLDCGITWFWTLTLNVKVRYRSLILPEGDLDADTVEVPADMVRDILVKDLAPHPAAADGACEKLHCEPLAPVSAMCAAVANGDSAQLCFDDLVAGRTTAALQCMQAKHRRLRAPDAAGPGDFVTSLAKLQHDAEMLAHLEVPGAALLRALHLAALRRYATRPTQAFEVRLPHNDPRREVFASVHRAVWMAPDARAEGEPMNLLDVDVERRLSSEGNAVVDGVLSDSALKIMQTHLQQSTMYYHREKSGAFLLASLDDGLASQLLAQIVEKLQEALPSIGRLCDAMAYKTLSVPTSSASFVSAQGASAAALLWLTPSKIDQVLSLPKPASAAEAVRHAVNRMVLWRDDCAATAPIWHHHSIESDYLHRTVHLVLRFQNPSCQRRRRPGAGPGQVLPEAAPARRSPGSLDAALSEDSFAAWDPFTDPSDARQGRTTAYAVGEEETSPEVLWDPLAGQRASASMEPEEASPDDNWDPFEDPEIFALAAELALQLQDMAALEAWVEQAKAGALHFLEKSTRAARLPRDKVQPKEDRLRLGKARGAAGIPRYLRRRTLARCKRLNFEARAPDIPFADLGETQARDSTEIEMVELRQKNLLALRRHPGCKAFWRAVRSLKRLWQKNLARQWAVDRTG
ncbi:unnamed protein product [Effrenium voratum]|uniref:Glycosyltransferase 61 catalytic domain-containing protein n=1 Tax=Effrenium voratum TaxID=2562239 RepID=A0AA36MUL4_9DINO|nr:unnamed protein product [Effrenium voratum]